MHQHSKNMLAGNLKFGVVQTLTKVYCSELQKVWLNPKKQTAAILKNCVLENSPLFVYH